MLIGIGKCYHLEYKAMLLAVAIIAFCYPVWAEIPAPLHINNAWIKMAPPGAAVNAAYAELYNPGNKPLVISGLSSTCCATLMLHRTVYKNDKAMMEHVDTLTIPAAKQVDLKPGDLHIMLLQSESPFHLGDEIAIQLLFADGQQQTVYFPVKVNGND